MTLRRAVLALVLITFCNQAGISDDQDRHLAQAPVRAVAGESRIIASKTDLARFESVTSVRATPEVEFPIWAAMAHDDTGRNGLRIVIPPATPADEYTVQITGLGSDGFALSTTVQVTVEQPTLQKSAPDRVPVILLNGWQSDCDAAGWDSTLEASRNTFSELGFILRDRDHVPVVYFNNCTYEKYYGVQKIEKIAAELGKYIASTKYSDGAPIPQWDLVPK